MVLFTAGLVIAILPLLNKVSPARVFAEEGLGRGCGAVNRGALTTKSDFGLKLSMEESR
jgi:hypothetical protein